MKILLAIIITATLSFGCAMLEGEQTTTDSGGGGTTAAPTGGGASTPTVSAESSVTSGRIATGDFHTSAIKADDTVQCWGYDNDGQSTVPSGLGSVKSIATSQYHTCAIKADDSVQCWGSDTYGESTVPAELQ